MAMLVHHILRHASGRVSFRRQYPPELPPFIPGPNGIGPTVLKVSLGREGSPGFLGRYEAALAQWEATVAQARRLMLGQYDTLDGPMIAEIVEAYRVAELQADTVRRWDSAAKARATQVTESMKETGLLPPDASPSHAADWTHSVRLAAGVIVEMARRLHANGDLEGIVDAWRPIALSTAESRGRLIHPSGPAFDALCVALNDAAVSAHEDIIQRLDGAFIPTPAAALLSRPAANDRRLKQPKAPVRLLALYDAYAAANEGMTSGVRDEWRKYVTRLVTFLGHDDASKLTADDLRAWRDSLLAETTPRGTLRSPVTVRDKYITPVRAALSFAVDEGLLPENVAGGVKVK